MTDLKSFKEEVVDALVQSYDDIAEKDAEELVNKNSCKVLRYMYEGMNPWDTCDSLYQSYKKTMLNSITNN